MFIGFTAVWIQFLKYSNVLITDKNLENTVKSRDSNTYDVYDVSPYGYFIQKTEAPFTELENGQCKFDSENKTITIYGSNGWNNAIRHIYQLKGREFELIQSE